jgi:hypothetical protein
MERQKGKKGVRTESDKMFITKDLSTICPRWPQGAPRQSRSFIGMSQLLPEKVLESLASIQRPGRGSLPFDGGSRREKVAMVAGVFFGNAGANRLSALEATRGIKKGALLTAM